MKDYGLKCPKCGSKLLCGEVMPYDKIPGFYIIDSPVCVNYKECGTVHVRLWLEKEKIPQEITS